MASNRTYIYNYLFIEKKEIWTKNPTVKFYLSIGTDSPSPPSPLLTKRSYIVVTPKYIVIDL